MRGTGRHGFLRRVCAACLLLVALGGATPAGAVPPPDYFAAPAFGLKYRETDGGEGYAPYFDNRANLGLPPVWGPQVAGKLEAWAGSPAGFRLVQYFQKGRMELTDPARADVTAGLLASELIAGRVDVGGGQSVALAPVRVAVAGDEDNPWLTYAGLTPYRDRRADAGSAERGEYVTLSLNLDLSETSRPQAMSDPQAQFAEYDGATGHAVPRAFAAFRADPRHPLGTVGYAITAPVWGRFRVGGTLRDVLVQAFERRVLTYTPDNPPAFRVEFGNIGRHYLRWRYGDPEGNAKATAPPLATGVSPALRVAYAAQGNPGLGAPLGPSRMLAAVVQEFADGTMLYLAEDRRIYVLFGESGGTGGRVLAFDDTWREGDDPGGAVYPPAGPGRDPLREPGRGFGVVWRENPEVRALGLTIHPERGFTGEVQRFERGFIVARPPGGATDLLVGTASSRWRGFACGNTAFRHGGNEVTPYACTVS